MTENANQLRLPFSAVGTSLTTMVKHKNKKLRKFNDLSNFQERIQPLHVHSRWGS